MIHFATVVIKLCFGSKKAKTSRQDKQLLFLDMWIG